MILFRVQNYFLDFPEVANLSCIMPDIWTAKCEVFMSISVMCYKINENNTDLLLHKIRTLV